MEHTGISNYTDLKQKILQLRGDKERIEDDLKESFSNLAEALSPLNLAKNALHGMVHDNEVKGDLAQAGMSIGANFIIDRVMGRNKSIKGFLSSILVEKIAGKLISNNSEKITSLIGSFFKPKENGQA